MKLGIFSNVLAAGSPEELAAKVRALGFECVQLWPPVPGVDLTPQGITEAACARVRRAFETEGIAIAALSGYTNLVHPDPERRQRDLEGFRHWLRWCRSLGAGIVVTETGTFNRQSEWAGDPYNETEEAWRIFLDVLEPLVRQAAQYDVTIALEAYVENVVHSPERARAAIEATASPHLRILMDPCNYFRPEMLNRQEDVLRHVFATVGEYIVLAHAKDVRAIPGRRTCELPRAGTGVLNYPLYIRLLRDAGYDGALIIEHLREPEIPETRDYVRRFL